MNDIVTELVRACPRHGKAAPRRLVGRQSPMLYALIGLGALAWFLVRVAPKPSRAGYPCQRVAGPLASGFLLWLLGASGWVLALRRAWDRLNGRRWGGVAALVAIAAAAIGWSLAVVDVPVRAQYAPHKPNEPLGTARGLRPGRVAWVHDPEVTDWAGPRTGERWHDHVDRRVAGEMISRAAGLHRGGQRRSGLGRRLLSPQRGPGLSSRPEGHDQDQPDHGQRRIGQRER